MSKYILNTMVVLLTLMLYRRSAVSFIKGKWAADKKAAAVSVSVGTVLLCGAVIYFLTFFEACFAAVIASVGFLMRYTLLEIFKAQYARKHGKLHVVKAVCIICFSFWLGLALFYKTDIGVKTGLKNYLYHKYHEEFKCIGESPDGAQFGFYPINGDRKADRFNVVRKRWLSIGSRLFASDNYYGIIIRDEYMDFCKKLINKYCDDAYVPSVRFKWSGFSNTQYMSDKFDKHTSLDEFLNYQKKMGKGCNVAELTVKFPASYFGSDSTQKIIYEFTNELADITHCVIIDFVYEKNDDNKGYTYATINAYGEAKIYNNEEKG